MWNFDFKQKNILLTTAPDGDRKLPEDITLSCGDANKSRKIVRFLKQGAKEKIN